jgi:hypothetical protein
MSDLTLGSPEGFDHKAFWNDPENYEKGKAAVERAREDAVECFERRRGIVDLAGHHRDVESAHAEVRMIAGWGARLVLSMQKNPAREDSGERSA